MCLRPMVRLSLRWSPSEPSAAFFFSASLVAAMRVTVISTGMTGSTEFAKVIWTGPLTWPQVMPVNMTAPKVRTSKKLAHIQSRSRIASASSLGFSLASLAAFASSGRSAT